MIDIWTNLHTTDWTYYRVNHEKLFILEFRCKPVFKMPSSLRYEAIQTCTKNSQIPTEKQS